MNNGGQILSARRYFLDGFFFCFLFFA
jgi:hypothetical protein